MTGATDEAAVRNPRASKAPKKARTRRADGERSRQKILAAAAEIAAERGYDGTSIAEISRRCGLPASSIYWHFKDKDDLMATVIEDSFAAWNQSWEIDADENLLTALVAVAEQLIGALRAHPQFLHIGLPLALQKRSDNPRPRQMYLQMRENLIARFEQIGATHFPHVPESRRTAIITYLIAGAEGLIISHELDQSSDIEEVLQIHATSVIQVIMQEASAWPT
ncbi:TetR/AcrR family transcriptional regulator [Corynebacterium terpenotabidum]|uniref:TetR family transcriptional regulator n=1 Tax=Corynebacterium terpenotabidum Y-11 TaxID=1200352 RepID=S4XBB5_9CORY|nr:TetR/AcrR family transcriptional regulator [Corynebacterium terpenotabidum]AGP29891.1 TetR family transcriptional regulator [Corynebacterium terpenotabidum Y-11]